MQEKLYQNAESLKKNQIKEIINGLRNSWEFGGSEDAGGSLMSGETDHDEAKKELKQLLPNKAEEIDEIFNLSGFGMEDEYGDGSIGPVEPDFDYAEEEILKLIP